MAEQALIHLKRVSILDVLTTLLIPGLKNQWQVGFCDDESWLVCIVRFGMSGTGTWTLPQPKKRKIG